MPTERRAVGVDANGNVIYRLFDTVTGIMLPPSGNNPPPSQGTLPGTAPGQARVYLPPPPPNPMSIPTLPGQPTIQDKLNRPYDPTISGATYGTGSDALASSVSSRKKKIAEYYAYGFGSTMTSDQRMKPLGGMKLLTL